VTFWLDSYRAQLLETYGALARRAGHVSQGAEATDIWCLARRASQVSVASANQEICIGFHCW